jgi:hypothetical protein
MIVRLAGFCGLFGLQSADVHLRSQRDEPRPAELNLEAFLNRRFIKNKLIAASPNEQSALGSAIALKDSDSFRFFRNHARNQCV